MKYRAVCYIDGLGKEHWRIQQKGWLWWHTVHKCLIPGYGNNPLIVAEYTSYEDMKIAVRNLLQDEESKKRTLKQVIPI